MKNKQYNVSLYIISLLLNINCLFSNNPGDIVITEFFYEKTSGNLPDYIEIYNTTETDINLNKWKLQIGTKQIEIDEITTPSNFVYRYQYIKSKSYLLLISDGFLKSQNGTTYCSANNFHPVFNFCNNDSTDQIFFHNEFPKLSSTVDTIIVIDALGVGIDTVKYTQNNNFPIQSGIGRSAEFIINPDSIHAITLNNLGENWKLSDNMSDSLWNGSNKDYGSPLHDNYIDPIIEVVNYPNPPLGLSINSNCYKDNIQTICKPGSDGYPGGEIAIKITASAKTNEGNSFLNLDLLESHIDSVVSDGNNVILDSYATASDLGEVLSWSPGIFLHKDVDSLSQDYILYILTRDNDKKRYGKAQKTISIREESNYAPIIHTINNQTPNSFIKVAENSEINLDVVVTDLELCSSLDSPCTLENLKYNVNGYWHDNTLPFLWSGDSIHLLSNINLLSNIFTANAIDSLNGISANSNPDTLLFTFKVSDPFGLFDIDSIYIIIENENKNPGFDVIILDQIMLEDEILEIELKASDTDGDSLFFKVESDENSTADIINNNRVRISPKMNYNGDIFITTYVHDNLEDSSSMAENAFVVSVLPTNDIPGSFNIDPNLSSYNGNLIDTTALEFDSTNSIYFRLPQDSFLQSEISAQLLKFKWEKNDSLDVDMIFGLNEEPSNLFYRLELNLDDSLYIILKDSISHNSFNGNIDSIYASINVEEKFNYYIDLYQNYIYNDKILLDINGNTNYKWRVIAQNYSSDVNDSDPYRVSSNLDKASFKIDLIQPEVNFFDIVINDLFPNYYDLVWHISEPLLADYTYLEIYEQENKFDASSRLNLRKISSSTYHVTGELPTKLISANIIFDLELRDFAMNSGSFLDTISFLSLSPDTSLTFKAPSKKSKLTFPYKTVSTISNIILTESNVNKLDRNNFAFYEPVTSMLSIYPLDIILNQKVMITFDLEDYLKPEINPRDLIICKINGFNLEPIATSYNEGEIYSMIENFGNYSVFLNKNKEDFLPEIFKIGLNHPNPFNTYTVIPISLPYESFIEVSVYDILGKKIDILLNDTRLAGHYTVQWDGCNNLNKPMSSGIYFILISYNNEIFSQKIMLLK